MKRVHVKVTTVHYLEYDVEDTVSLETIEEKAGSEAWQHDADETDIRVTKVERLPANHE